jgi:hypothetical protein
MLHPGVNAAFASMGLWCVCIIFLLVSMVANCTHQAARFAETKRRADVLSPVNPAYSEQCPAASIMP